MIHQDALRRGRERVARHQGPGRRARRGGRRVTTAEAERAIDRETARQLCREIRQENRNKWYRWTAWWCWGCVRFSGGEDQMCFANHPENRGCAQVNARYEAGR